MIKKQIKEIENQSIDKEVSLSAETAPQGIVSIKAQDVDYELPMNPITVMRNSLGKDEGGSGVPIDRDAYLEALNQGTGKQMSSSPNANKHDTDTNKKKEKIHYITLLI